MVAIRTPPNQRIIPLWNTQGFVNACAASTGATNWGTYLGHSPSAERATDGFSTIPMPRSNRVLGDAIAEFALEGRMPNGVSVWDYYGIRYIIWRQRINWNDGAGWRLMENRGGDTQNHFDHDHLSFNVIPAPPAAPIPTILQGGSEVLILNVDNTGIFLLRGSEVSHLQHPNHVMEWVRAGVPYQDRVSMSKDVFSAYTGWGADQIRGLIGSGLPEGDDTAADDEIARQYQELLAAVQEMRDQEYNDYIRMMQS